MEIRCLNCMELYNEEFGVCPYCGYVEGSEEREAIHMPARTLLKGRYLIGKVLGYGGFGVTYLAWDETLQQKVAIKEYLPTEFSTRIPGQSEVSIFAGDKNEQFYDGLDKFIEEAQRLAKFQNEDGIVKVFDSFEENSTAYLVMEYLDGMTLTQYMKKSGTIPEEVALEMLLPVMSSLAKVHQDGIIHRDIAPDNIFLTKDGHVKLIDFGASRYATTTHSRSLTVIIKPGYSPEEQYRSRGDQGPWTDVYALAATMYRMITGQTPADALERRAKIETKRKDLLQPPHKYHAISRKAEVALLNALNVQIEDRTQSVEQFIEELTAPSPAKRKYGKIKAIDFYNWPLWSKITAIGLSAAMVVFGVLMATGVIRVSSLFSTSVTIPDGMVSVPDVEGLHQDEAIRLIVDGNLLASAKGSIESPYVEAGVIVLQSPNSGIYVTRNSSIELIISSGAAVVEAVNGIATVPYLIWDMQEDAIAKLHQAGLGDPEIILQADETVEAGRVIGQSVSNGKEVEEGTVITIVVSTGPAPFAMPDVTGMTLEEAQTLLYEAKLVVSVEYQFDNTIKAGTVLYQNITAGADVTRGTEVILTVSGGKQTRSVPNVQGMTRGSAISVLEEQGFRTAVQEVYDNEVMMGFVVRQTPSGGSEQEEGALITIYVSLGTKPEESQPSPGTGNSDNVAGQESRSSQENSSGQTSRPSQENSSGQGSRPSQESSSGQSSRPSQESSSGQNSRASQESSKQQENDTDSPKDSTVRVESVSLDYSTLALGEGEGRKLVATIYPSNATNQQLNWSSSDNNVVMVSDDGLVVAVGLGQATVTVETVDGKKKDQCLVTVSSVTIPVTGISLNKTELSLIEKASETLIATIQPANATNRGLTWSSSNSKVAKASDSGKVTAVKSGTATITVTTSDGNYSASCSVTVASAKVDVTGVSLNATSLDLRVDETSQLTAAVTPDNATNKSVNYSTDNPAVAKVDGNGLVTAVGTGSATITVKTADGGYTATCSVNVKPNSYTLYLDPQGGTVSETSKVLAPNSAYGDLPTPSREGYSFDGWYTANGAAVSASTSIGESDATIYASWSVLSYTLSYSAGTGCSISVSRTSSPYAQAGLSALSSGSTIYYGDVLSVSYGAVTGYYLTSTGLSSITVTSNVDGSMIYASAAAESYTYNVYYYSTNGTYLGSDSITRSYGTSETVSAPGKSGYDTPGAQTVVWDSASKDITFYYPPSAVSASSDYVSLTYSETGREQVYYACSVSVSSRTADSATLYIYVETGIRGKAGWDSYGQNFKASYGGYTTGNTQIVPYNTWRNKSDTDRSASTVVYLTVPISGTGATSINLDFYYFQTNSNWSVQGSNASRSLTVNIPAY